MKIAVINNREGLVQGQMQPAGVDSAGRKIIGPVVTLLPGLNLVDKKQLEELRKNPGFELNFATKIAPSPAPEQNPEKVGKPILELLQAQGKDGKDAPVEVEDALPLAKLSEKQAKLLISETLVEGTLKQWDREETRPAVRYEIAQQITKISGKPAGPAALQ